MRVKAWIVEISIVSILAASFCSFTLWILDFPYKYVFYVLQIFTALILFSAVRRRSIKIGIKAETSIFKYLRQVANELSVALLLAVLSILMLVDVFKMVPILRLIIALLLSSFLPGYVLLSQWRSFLSLSFLERIILSYLTGFSLVSVMTFILNTVLHHHYWSEINLLLFVLLGFSCAIKGLVRKKPHRPMVHRKLFSSPIDFFGVIVILLFFLTATFCLFPDFTLMPGTDISDHHGYSQALVRTPRLRGLSAYLFFDLWLGFLYKISDVGIVLMQTALQLLNFMPILAFYMMARKHLEHIDRRLPLVSAIFWTIFSSLGWLYVAHLKLSNYTSQFSILCDAAGKTYNSTIYATGLFIRGNDPTGFTFVFLFVFLSILSRKKLEKIEYLGLFPFLFVSWYAIHRIEFLIFSIFVALYHLIKSRDKRTHMREKILISALLGFAGIGIIEFTAPLLFSPLMTRTKNTFVAHLAEITSTLLVVFSIALSRTSMAGTFLHMVRCKLSSKSKEISWLLFYLFFLSLFGWMLLVKDFSLSTVIPIRNVPWYFYSLLLGISGFVSVAGVYYWLSNSESRPSLGLFIFFGLFALVFGKLITILKMNFIDLPYWENRVLRLISISTAILSSLFVIYLSARISTVWKGKKRLIQTSTVAFLISLIVLSGTTATILCCEYGYYRVRSNTLSKEELEARKALQAMLEKNPYSIVSVISQRSKNLVESSTAPRIPLEWLSREVTSPTSMIYMLSRTEKDWTTIPYNLIHHRYLYLSREDQEYVQLILGQTYLNQILPYLPLVFNNSEASIYELPYSASPLLDADVALIEPFTRLPQLSNYHFTHALPSLSPYNYTVRYDLDSDIWRKNCLVLSFDPKQRDISLTILRFDGVDDYVEILNSPSIDITGPISIEVCFKLKETHESTSSRKVLVDKSNPTGTYSGGGFILSLEENGRLTFSKTDGTKNIANPPQPNWDQVATNLNVWHSDVWYHVTVVWDGTTNQNSMEIYINGELDAQDTAYQSSIKANDYNLTVGGSQIHKSLFSGEMRDLRIYNRALSHNEVRHNHKESDDPVTNGLQLWLPMDEKKGSTAYDKSGNENDGMIYEAEHVSQRFLREPEEYMAYIRSGGKVIVANTNGYGFFSESIGLSMYGNHTASEIKGSYVIEIPDVTVPTIQVGQEGEVLSNYIYDQNKESPLAVRKQIGEGEIIYLNIYPLINFLTEAENQRERSAIYLSLGKILQTSNITLRSRENPVRDVYYIFKRARLDGNVTLTAKSLLLPQEMINSSVVSYEGEEIFGSFMFTIEDLEELSISLESAELSEGEGLYTKIVTEGNITVNFVGQNRITVRSIKREITLNNVTQITFNPEKSMKIYVLLPNFQVNGNITLEEEGRQTDSDLIYINGEAEFSIFYSDAFTMSSSITGKFNTEIVKLDEK